MANLSDVEVAAEKGQIAAVKPLRDELAGLREVVDALRAEVASFEQRVFDRDKANAPWSITNELHYGNDLILAKLDQLLADASE